MLRLLLLPIWFAFHPVHVTLTSVDYDEGTRDFKVFVRLYMDDLLLDCRLNGNDVAEIRASTEPADVTELEKYLNDKLIISVNDKPLTGKIREVSVSDNEVSVTVIAEGASKPRSVSVRNLIMTKLYMDQSNLVIVRVADFEEGVKLTPELTEKTFKLN